MAPWNMEENENENGNGKEERDYKKACGLV